MGAVFLGGLSIVGGGVCGGLVEGGYLEVVGSIRFRMNCRPHWLEQLLDGNAKLVRAQAKIPKGSAQWVVAELLNLLNKTLSEAELSGGETETLDILFSAHLSSDRVD